MQHHISSPIKSDLPSFAHTLSCPDQSSLVDCEEFAHSSYQACPEREHNVTVMLLFCKTDNYLNDAEYTV
jgi:hypothetical protein